MGINYRINEEKTITRVNTEIYLFIMNSLYFIPEYTRAL